MRVIFKYGIKLNPVVQIDEANDGMQALDKIKRDFEENGFSSYPLILMDCNMPFMDGYEATKQIREFIRINGLPQPTIIAVTGHTEQLYIDKSLKSGMNTVLSKPVDPTVLKEIIVDLKCYEL